MYYSRRWDTPEKPVGYVTIEHFNAAVKSLVRNDEKVLNAANTAIERTEDLYARHDTMRADLNELLGYENTIRYLWQEVEKLKDAPNVAKRKRRVTICANGQRVDIKRV